MRRALGVLWDVSTVSVRREMVCVCKLYIVAVMPSGEVLERQRRCNILVFTLAHLQLDGE